MDGRETSGGGAIRAGELGLVWIELDRPLFRETIVVTGAGRAVFRELAGRPCPGNVLERQHLREALAPLREGEQLELSEGIGWRSLTVRGPQIVSVEVPAPDLRGWSCTCARYEDRSRAHERVQLLVEELAWEPHQGGMASAPTVA